MCSWRAGAGPTCQVTVTRGPRPRSTDRRARHAIRRAPRARCRRPAVWDTMARAVREESGHRRRKEPASRAVRAARSGAPTVRTGVAWPSPDETRVPLAAYSDPDLYRLEQERIFRGPSWSYVCLSVEVGEPGSFLRSTIGDRPVIVTR